MKIPDDAVDIGCGHKIKLLSYEGEVSGLNDYHLRPDNGEVCVGFISFTGRAWAHGFSGRIDTWEVECEDPLTLSPSLLCRACGDHGFIRAGRWVRA